MTLIQSPLSAAVSRAIAEAEVRRIEMSRTLPPAKVAELLHEQAESAARLPLAYDQLLSHALKAAAAPGEAEHVLDELRLAPDPFARFQLAREVLSNYARESSTAVVRVAPDWELRRARRRIGKNPEALAAWLRSAAELNRALWDHPALPADVRMRGAMLACVTMLGRRAEVFAPESRQRPVRRTGEVVGAGTA